MSMLIHCINPEGNVIIQIKGSLYFYDRGESYGRTASPGKWIWLSNGNCNLSSSFGSSLGHGTRFGFGIFEFAKSRFGSPGPDRGPTSSFARIDNYRGYTGRLSKKCIKARGQLSAEEIYWPTGKDNQTGCRPKSTLIPGHYHTLRKAKINSILAYLYYKWNGLSGDEKDKYKTAARGRKLNGINLYIKEYMLNWGFNKSGFGEYEFGSYHQPFHFYGFSTVAFGIAAFGTPYPQPRRFGFGIQSFGEMRFGSNLRTKRIIGEFS